MERMDLKQRANMMYAFETARKIVHEKKSIDPEKEEEETKWIPCDCGTELKHLPMDKYAQFVHQEDGVDEFSDDEFEQHETPFRITCARKDCTNMILVDPADDMTPCVCSACGKRRICDSCYPHVCEGCDIGRGIVYCDEEACPIKLHHRDPSTKGKVFGEGPDGEKYCPPCLPTVFGPNYKITPYCRNCDAKWFDLPTMFCVVCLSHLCGDCIPELDQHERCPTCAKQARCTMCSVVFATEAFTKMCDSCARECEELQAELLHEIKLEQRAKKKAKLTDS